MANLKIEITENNGIQITCKGEIHEILGMLRAATIIKETELEMNIREQRTKQKETIEKSQDSVEEEENVTYKEDLSKHFDQ